MLDVRVPVLKVDVRGNLPLFGNENRLDQASNARAALQMANVWLDGPNIHGLLPGTRIAERRGDGLELAPVAHFGSGTMALDIGRLILVQAGIPIRRIDAADLCIRVRHRDT